MQGEGGDAGSAGEAGEVHPFACAVEFAPDDADAVDAGQACRGQQITIGTATDMHP